MQDENVKVEGLDEVYVTLDTLENKLSNTKPLMTAIAHHLEEIVHHSFEVERTPDGKSWSPIKPRKGDKSPTKILKDSGHMQETIYSKSTNTTATVGLNAVSGNFQYPLTHQFGTNKAGKNRNITIEARPFMPIKSNGSLYDGLEKELEELVDDYLSLK